MTKQQFLHQLNKHLKKIPHTERAQAVAFYEEYLSDATDEAAAIANLPHPKQIAAKIIVEVGTREQNIPILTIVLAIFSAPITIPLAASMFAVVLSLFITIVTLILVPYIVFGATLVSSVVMAITTVPAFLWNLETGLVFLGFTICFFAGSLLGLLLFHKLARALFNLFRRVILKIGKRSTQHES